MSSFIVVNADDLGMSIGANLGILEAHRHGIVTSASIVPAAPAYRHALETVVRTSPNLGIGLHFCLSAGRSVASPEAVPLLVNEQGFLRWRFESLLWESRSRSPLPGLFEQIEIELEAQLARLAQDGIAIDHINSERHIHLVPRIFEIVVSAAQRHNIRHVRVIRDIGRHYARWSLVPNLVTRGALAKYYLLQRLAAQDAASGLAGVNTTDYFASLLFTGQMHLVMDAILQRPPDGALEMMVHPGLPDGHEPLELGNQGLEAYLIQSDRKLELEGCLQSAPTGAVLGRFSDLPVRKGEGEPSRIA